jgi:hypothetical protein
MIDLKVYDNGDHTCLVWLTSDEKPIQDCRGFTIHKTLTASAGARAVFEPIESLGIHESRKV